LLISADHLGGSPQTLASSWDACPVEAQHTGMASEFRDRDHVMLLYPTNRPRGRSVYEFPLFVDSGSDTWLSGKMFGVGILVIQ
jgi:hypothetical protein